MNQKLREIVDRYIAHMNAHEHYIRTADEYLAFAEQAASELVDFFSGRHTPEIIIKARDVAPACSPAIARLLEGKADALERLALAELIAYEAARSGIECMAVMEKSSWRSGSGNWYSVTGLRNDNGEQDYVNRVIAYLDSRGLIERDAQGLVRVMDVKEAKGDEE